MSSCSCLSRTSYLISYRYWCRYCCCAHITVLTSVNISVKFSVKFSVVLFIGFMLQENSLFYAGIYVLLWLLGYMLSYGLHRVFSVKYRGFVRLFVGVSALVCSYWAYMMSYVCVFVSKGRIFWYTFKKTPRFFECNVSIGRISGILAVELHPNGCNWYICSKITSVRM